MAEMLPLDELAIRKRLLQAHLAIQRSVISTYVEEIASPFRRLGASARSMRSNPVAHAVVVGGIGFLFFSRRFKWMRSSVRYAAPLIWPQLRKLAMNRAVGW